MEASVAPAPHPALRPFVAGMVGYRQEGLPPGVHRGLPSPFLTLVLPIDEPLRIAAHPDPRQSPGTYDALVGGLHTRPALVAHPGRQVGVQLALTPRGARALLGVPAAALAATDVELADVLGARAAELTGRLREARDWPGRFAVLEGLLLGLVQADDGPPPEVAEAWRMTTASGGRLRVDELARRVGWSPRHLTERFRAETGLAPKEAARVVRFDRARRALVARAVSGAPLDLAGLAAAGGWYDQAHLTRDWRAFAGLPPTRWLAEEFGFVQDAALRTRAGSAA